MEWLTKRSNQLWILLILSAATMIIPYQIQGFMSSGKSPGAIPVNIWLADHWAWSIRAIVEGLVIGYLARTRTDSKVQAAILWTLKIALIVLIALTLGPVMYSTMNNETMAQSLSPIAQRLWTFGLASYMPLMVLGAAYAYKVQPNDTDLQVDATIPVAERQKWQQELQTVQTDLEAAQSHAMTLQTELKQAQTWEAMSFADKARWIAVNCNGDRPAAADLAASWGCSVSTVSRAYKSVDR